MTKTIHRKGGGQPGNQNARKHGFYSRVLTADQERLLPSAATMKGLERNIEVAQVRLLSIMAYKPEDHKLLFRGLAVLNRLVREQNTAKSRASATANRTMRALLKSMARPAQNDARS